MTTWPPVDQILAAKRNKLPPRLAELIAERYTTLGAAYGTSAERDGLPVNACMTKDNLQDVEEELVDAVFNALVYNMRWPAHGNYLIDGLNYVWRMLQEERELSIHDNALRDTGEGALA